jgi:hypothetical protein
MLLVLGYALLAAAFFIAWHSLPAFWRVVDECRADAPTRHFSRLNWWPAWIYHMQHFPKSELRKRILLRCALGCILLAGSTVLLQLSGHFPRWGS